MKGEKIKEEGMIGEKNEEVGKDEWPYQSDGWCGGVWCKAEQARRKGGPG